jgi:predicted N-formylglutamate amidohydrolase
VLLGADDPPPFDVSGREAPSPFVIICDHASRRLPQSLGSLGLASNADADIDGGALATHIAWDIGALGVARALASALDAFVAWQRYSRLVIDCNRPLSSADSIVKRSERTDVPGNANLTASDAAARAAEVFRPYHAEIRNQLDARRAARRPAILVSVHSFTPVFLDVARPWHCGVLFNRDARLAEPVLRLLRDEPGLCDEPSLIVGCNEPYAASDLTDFSLVHHGEARGIPCVEIEIRQDLISDDDPAAQNAWAQRLARVLSAAAQPLLARL